MRRSAPRLTSPISLLAWASLILLLSSPRCDAALTVSLNVSGEVLYGQAVGIKWTGGSAASYKVGVQEQEGSAGEGGRVLLTSSATGDEYGYSGFESDAWGEGNVAFFVESDDEEGWSDLITLTSSTTASAPTTSSSSAPTTFSVAAVARSVAPATTTSNSPASTADTTSSTSPAASASSTSASTSHLSTGSAISVGIGLGVAGMAALVGLLFYVYRRGIMAAARGHYRHKEVPSEEPYPQHQHQPEPLPPPPPPPPRQPISDLLSMQASTNFLGGYAGAAGYGPHRDGVPRPLSAGGASFAAGLPPQYGLPPGVEHPARGSAYQPSEAAYDYYYQPPDAKSFAGAGAGAGEGGGGGGGGWMAEGHAAPGRQRVVAELEREPSRPYAELDPSPKYFAELGGQEEPLAYAELPGARENSR